MTAERRVFFSQEVLTVLNAWFHEHFKNPYPTEEEKAELAAQCNLQVKQVRSCC